SRAASRCDALTYGAARPPGPLRAGKEFLAADCNAHASPRSTNQPALYTIKRRPRGSDGPGQGLATRRLEAPRGLEAGRTGTRPARRPRDALQRAARRFGSAHRLDKPNDRLLAWPV